MRNYIKVIIAFMLLGCSHKLVISNPPVSKTSARLTPAPMTLQFNSVNEDSVLYYIIYRSVTGNVWTTVGTLPKKGKPSTYTVPMKDSYGYFRVGIRPVKGKYKYSKNVYVNK